MTRSIRSIALDIETYWQTVNYGARPYLDAMHTLDKPTDRFGEDDAIMILAYFLGNATGWRGEKAREIKAEIRRMLK